MARMTSVVGFWGLGNGRLHALGLLPSVWFWSKRLQEGPQQGSDLHMWSRCVSHGRLHLLALTEVPRGWLDGAQMAGGCGTPGDKQGRPGDSAEGCWALEEKAVLGGPGGVKTAGEAV